MKWINASEKVPGYLKKGLSKMSDYVAIHFYSDYDGRIITSTARYCHDRNKWFDIMHNSENNNEVNPIEWLDESPSPAPDWTKEKTYDSEGTVDKEAILNKWLDQCFENRLLHFDIIGKILEAMDEHTASLRKENEELRQINESVIKDRNCYRESFEINKDQFMELAAHAKDLELSNEAKEKECEYWKQRCEAAEQFVKDSPCDPDITWNQQVSYEKWQQLKNKTPNQ